MCGIAGILNPAQISLDDIALVKKMIAREGIGDLLADGVKVAARKLGVSAKDYAVHAGGQEPGMHDSRMDPMIGIHYSADPTPGRHPSDVAPPPCWRLGS